MQPEEAVGGSGLSCAAASPTRAAGGASGWGRLVGEGVYREERATTKKRAAHNGIVKQETKERSTTAVRVQTTEVVGWKGSGCAEGMKESAQRHRVRVCVKERECCSHSEPQCNGHFSSFTHQL